jgi:hypothetical protein
LLDVSPTKNLYTCAVSGHSVSLHAFSDLMNLLTLKTGSAPLYVETNDTTSLSYHWTSWLATPSTVIVFSVMVPLPHFFIYFSAKGL